MLSKISNAWSAKRFSEVADWAVLTVGVVMLATAVAGTLLTPAPTIQAGADLAGTATNAAL
ncbi:MAG: hypothetical protein AAGF13_01950 [Pseudomonadota bacterium]